MTALESLIGDDDSCLVLLGFAAWTLLTLFTTIGVYRWIRILTGRAAIAEWRADEVQGSEWYRRALRAHMNCVENLPVYTLNCSAL
jgi:MAPEG family